MKRSFFFLALVGLGCLTAAGSDSLRLTEIRYIAHGAREVTLVWGINNWQKVPQALWPAGSYLKDNLLYTPMKEKSGYFSTQVKVPKNTLLDYVFWISKGFRNAPADVWDTNELPDKDYHTLVSNNNITLVESSQNIVPQTMLTLLDLSIPIFLSLLVILCGFVFYKRKRSLNASVGSTNILLSSAATLFLFLLFIRPSITGVAWDLYDNPFHNLTSLFKPALYDFVFVCTVTVIFWLITLSLSRLPRLQKGISFGYAFFCLLFLIIGLLNIRIVEALGKPFTYQWLYYADFLNSTDAKSALVSNIDRFYILRLTLVILSAGFFCYLLINVNLIFWNTAKKRKAVFIALPAISAAYLFYAVSSSPEKTWEINKMVNPVTAFLQSTDLFSGSPALFTMEVADSLQYHPAKNTVASSAGNSKIKNVILFVLESTPAEYISAYKGKYEVTPELSKHLKNALVFKNIYAHAPATNNSMVSLLGSIYPMISYVTITQKYPGLSIPTLSSELKKKNYKTAFFNSADNRFQHAGEFLSHRKFDVINDCRDRAQFSYQSQNYLSGSNDETTAQDMMSWIGKNRNEPFFAMMWTYQTHYPYFAGGQETSYKTNDPVFNRYLNAVHHSDKVFGQLMEYLKATGLYESTLVVLVGDHGEAFGRHGQTTHASHIYEENLHVPCIFLNPAFMQKEYNGLGGLIDIAPTVMNILNIPKPASWHGKDLFTANEDDRVYFFSPWSDYLFGYREGKHKYIFNATHNLTEVYDLEADPLETHNLAAVMKDRIEISHQRLAGWIQSVNHFMEEKLRVEP